MKIVTKYIELILPTLFGLVVFYFFAFPYQNHLHYQEQLQLFLFTSDYWADLMSRPGGLADYLGTFFTQFYYFSWLGALIIAGMLVLVQQQVKVLSNRLKQNSQWLPLTFIPSLLFWNTLCDENFLLSAVIAANLTLLAAQFYTYLKKPLVRIVVAILCLPILYWLAGGVFWVFGLMCILLEWGYFKQLSKIQVVMLFVGVLIAVVAPPLITKNYLQYPLSRLWWGLSYNRYPVISPYPLLTIWVSLLLVPLLFKWLPLVFKKGARVFYVVAQVIVLLVLGVIGVRMSADWSKEEIMAYDYAVRMQNWNKVVDMANHKDPKAPLSVACLNLALAKTGTMGDSMFRYFQNGPEGLLPTFQRDFTMPFVAGEVYYHLGFLNTSMRFNFEAMEAIPDYKKSSRAMQRIAEVNLLNGENKVAAKYLHLLQHTLFYSNWATDALACVGNEKAIDANPQWASLRKFRLTEDFLFSEDQKDQMLGLLFSHCTTNKMAYEYLIAYTLLTKDIEHFVQYFPLGKQLGYREIPAHYQEALLAYWVGTGHNLRELPWPVSPAIEQQFNNFIRLSNSGVYAEAQIKESFSQSYWYYLQFRK